MAFFGAEIKHFRSNNYLLVQNKLFDLSTPRIMGVINVTPDSFYKNSRLNKEDDISIRVSNMVNAGMDILDIGACSTRPGAIEVSEQEEIDRILPIIERVKKDFPTLLLSIDTFRSNVAEIALKNGIHIINDVQGGNFDPRIWEVAANYKAPYILTHSRGNSQNMQELINYENVTLDVLQELSEKIARIKKAGVIDIIIDLGFGFAKTPAQNFELLNHLAIYSMLEHTLLCGFSRKSMIYKRLNISVEESLNGTTILNTYALTKGAKIIRVHDVTEAKQIFDLLKNE
jgi:dihydropteroate synthase